MANETYQLNNTATEVESAIGSVIDSTVTEPNKILQQGSNHLATHSSVYTALNTAVGDLAGKTVTTEATGIENTDNDTSIPTSAAVLDYVNAQQTGVVAVCKAADGQAAPIFTNLTLSFSITYQNNNSVSISGSDVVLAEGKYLVQFSGIFNEDDNDVNDYAKVILLKNNSEVFSTLFDETGSTQQIVNSIGVNHFEVTSGASSTWSVQIEPISQPYVRWKSVTLIFTKLI